MVFAQDMVFNILTGLMGWRRAKAKALVTLAMEMVKKEGG
jgi:transposase